MCSCILHTFRCTRRHSRSCRSLCGNARWIVGMGTAPSSTSPFNKSGYITTILDMGQWNMRISCNMQMRVHCWNYVLLLLISLALGCTVESSNMRIIDFSGCGHIRHCMYLGCVCIYHRIHIQRWTTANCGFINAPPTRIGNGRGLECPMQSRLMNCASSHATNQPTTPAAQQWRQRPAAPHWQFESHRRRRPNTRSGVAATHNITTYYLRVEQRHHSNM